MDDNKAKPTPGPWAQRTLMVVDSHGGQICHTRGTRYRGQTPQPYEAMANARLIAAAPELRDALAEFREFVLSNATQWTPDGSHHNPIWAKVADVLAKAGVE